MKITVRITKQVLKESFMCGYVGENQPCVVSSSGCAVAVAVREFFPKADVSPWFFFTDTNGVMINLPQEATDFISDFDRLRTTPKERLELPEISFEIDVPSAAIESIGISQAYKILSESKTLELISI